MPAFETYLFAPLIEDPAAFRPRLQAALAALRPASVLLRFGEGDERSLINRLKALAPVAQEAGVAALLEGPANVAVRGGADGAHMGAPALLPEARETLRGERILGAGGLSSRHDAMEAGEIGVDYVMFGEPRPDGSLMPFSALLDRASWWAQLFETPCVAYAPTPESVEKLAWTRAEFIALGPWCFEDPEAAAETVRRARANAEAQPG